MGKKNKNGIPERWTDYTAVGKRIPGTRFIAFKVPLKKSFEHLTRSEAFGPSDLVHLVKKEKEDLGLIIDLTFTTRYYSVQDLPNSVLYLKIFTKGQEVPSNSTILSFKKAVRHFLRENQHNDKLIGVHCTHGLNRTGYLICRYLIDVDGMKHTKAIQLFNSSRGHSIERENYLEDLREGPQRSNKGMDKPEQDPVRGCAPEMLHPPHEHSNPTHHMPPVNAWAPHWHHVHPPQNFSIDSVFEQSYLHLPGLLREVLSFLILTTTRGLASHGSDPTHLLLCRHHQEGGLREVDFVLRTSGDPSLLSQELFLSTGGEAHSRTRIQV
ncbi:hypothetical protein DNTS_008576 [Danionella cerebrum]|uniref:RNA/RNP complex-1-interacting phosphatase n=1 Tax=Danionella cerebrum TaxID=2873325 RepID=A0A553Q6B4_9TELE|nr:hypothetical protein DNTS_008576 [Danionella translucida]